MSLEQGKVDAWLATLQTAPAPVGGQQEEELALPHPPTCLKHRKASAQQRGTALRYHLGNSVEADLLGPRPPTQPKACGYLLAP